MTNSRPDQLQPDHVVVAGGGVAGLEAVMALRELAGDRVRITLVAPDDDFVYRPLTVGDPFALGSARRVPLERFAAEFGAELRQDRLDSVFPEAHTVFLAGGDDLTYDRLIVAVGASAVPAYQHHGTTFRGQEDVEAIHGLVQDVEEGYVHRIVFVVPPGVAWSLPLYELALMTARRAFEMEAEVELTFVTPEERPLPVFGPRATADVAARLAKAGIRTVCSTIADIPRKGAVLLRPSGELLECDRLITLPVARPIRIKGLPTDSEGFLPIDSHCRVGGVADVYAAGDGANFPLKQGGLACQQADVAAENIARSAGVPVGPASFRPVLRGQLLTGEKPQFMRHDLSGRGTGRDESSEHLLWWPPTKIAGKYLAPYMAVDEEQDRAATMGNGVRRRALVTPALDGSRDIELRGYEFASR
ncbi:MAG: NAD(P)/FAD-dependent oxidoreductase [Thermoleophilaceae bacterium]